MDGYECPSPIVQKLNAVQKELTELDEEILNISLELDDNNSLRNPNINFKNRKFETPNSRNNSKYSSKMKMSNNSIARSYSRGTPKTSNINSSLHIEDLISSSDSDEDFNKSDLVSKKSKLNQSKSHTENNSFNSNRNSTKFKKTPSHLYDDSVKIIEKRTHSLIHDDWGNNSDTELFTNDHSIDNNNEIDFPKLSDFTYNNRIYENYSPLSDMNRIKETKKKREEFAKSYQMYEERKLENECTFKPQLSTIVPDISPEEQYKILIKNKKRKESCKSEITPKSIRYINPHSEQIAKKAQAKGTHSLYRASPVHLPPTPDVKYLSKKRIEKSCERLSKPRSSLDEFEQECDQGSEKKYADQETIERLFVGSTRAMKKKSSNIKDENNDHKSFIDLNSQKIVDEIDNARTVRDLYEESIQCHENIFEKQKQAQKFKEMLEMSACTFHPKINEQSIKIASNASMKKPITKQTNVPTTPKMARKQYYSPIIKSAKPMKNYDNEIDQILEEVDEQLHTKWSQDSFS